MELAQTKTPYLPPDWTVARGLKYAAKLGVFVLVPGLHQIACKRRILGGLILFIFVASNFIFLNQPSESKFLDFLSPTSIMNFSSATQYATWILLSIDLNNLESRRLKPGHIIPLAFFFSVHLMPFTDHRITYVHIEQKNTVCPVFCKFDIVKWDFRNPYVEKISEGDYVVMGHFGSSAYATRLLAGPIENYLPGTPREVCSKYRLKSQLPQDLCEDFLDTARGSFIIRGGPKPEFKLGDGREGTMILGQEVMGFRPRKIGNLHDYFIFSDEVTEFVGTTLLTVYKWTGLNLFGLPDRWVSARKADQIRNAFTSTKEK